MEVDLPSGKRIEIRKMKLSDQNILANAQYQRKGNAIDKLLEAVTGLPENAIDRMLIGDRFYALIFLRRISLGEIYSPKVTCGNCKTRKNYEINLAELKCQMLDKSLVNDDYRFELVLPEAKKKIVCRLLTGVEERKLKKIKADFPDEIMTHLMMIRVAEVEGMRHKDKKWFEDLSYPDTTFFRQEYEKRDCGIETEIELECDGCGSVFDLELPFDKTFFLGS